MAGLPAMSSSAGSKGGEGGGGKQGRIVDLELVGGRRSDVGGRRSWWSHRRPRDPGGGKRRFRPPGSANTGEAVIRAVSCVG